jgi:phenylacetate-CoA ligase
VANEYGCRDGALIAHECPAQRLHLMHDAVHVEILDDDGRPVPPGEPGEICLTNLLSPGAPLIRYRLGDRARLDPEPCPCGRPHPVLAELQGRQADTLVHEDGRRVHGLALIYVLRELGGVERFRCVQSRRDHLRIEVVPDHDFDPTRVQTGIIDRVHRVLGPGMNVEVALVETLAPLPSGKHRYIVNELPEDPA